MANTNKKITELLAATAPLTGTEIVPLVQGGTTDRTTAQDIANLAPPAVFDPADPATIVETWPNLNPIFSRGAHTGNVVNLFGDFNDGSSLNLTADSGTPNAATKLLQSARRRQIFYTQTGADGLNGTTLYQNTPSDTYRRMSGADSPVGGLFLYARFGWYYDTTATNSCRMFHGFAPSNGMGINASDGAFNTLTNLVGIGKYDTDTNISFVYNDNAGAITKVDMGVSFAALAGHLLELYIYSDYQSDSVSIVMRDLDSGTDYSHTATSNLPAVDQRMYWDFAMNNGFHQDSNNLGLWVNLKSVLINPGF